jgi:chromosome partitioning protein
MTKTQTPYAVLLTRTQSRIQKSLISAGIPVFATELKERDAYRAVFSFQQTLDGLNPSEVSNLDQAKVNVWEFVEEVIKRLTEGQGGREENETSNVAGAA